MRFVVDSVRDYAILTLDPEGRVSSWNTGAQRMFGYEPDEILGKPIDILFTPEDRAAGRAAGRAAPRARGRPRRRTSAGTCARTARASTAAA